MSRLILFLVFSFTLFQAKANKPLLRAAISDGVAAPLLLEDKTAVKGIIPDYLQALADLLGREYEPTLLARNRIDGYLRDGKVDVLCYTNRAWAKDPLQFYWSKPFFTKREVIFGPLSMAKNVGDLSDITLGTTLNYVYPKLDPLFISGKLKREDAPSEKANLTKLLNGRVHYVVTDELFIEYFKVTNPEIDKNRKRILLDDFPISCCISKKSNLTLKKLNEAIDKLKSSRKLEKIFKTYGLDYK